MTQDEGSSLEYFFSAYFHQDCLVIDRSADDVVRRFLRREHSQVVGEARCELQELLSSSQNEEELLATLDRLGCLYDPRPAGTSVRAWLERVEQLLGQSPEGPDSS
jgi:hypothetical protein